MKNIFSYDYEHSRTILYVSLLTCYAIIAFYSLNAGFTMSSDSQRFSRWADDLIRFNFNLFEFYSIEKADNRPNLFFFLYSSNYDGIMQSFVFNLLAVRFFVIKFSIYIFIINYFYKYSFKN